MPLKCDYMGLLPKMHVCKQTCRTRNNWFLSHQLPALNAEMPFGKQENVYLSYPAKKFANFLSDQVLKAKSEYLRIYFACIDDKLDLIYAVKDVASETPKEFYFIYTEGNFTFLPKGTPTTTGSASYYVKEFLQKKAEIIKASSDVNGPTQAMKFSSENIKDFLTEITEQSPISIKACFSSYTDTETNPRVYPKMMFVDFVFTSFNALNKEVESYIDDCPGFSFRNKETKKMYMEKDLLTEAEVEYILNFDNSTLCPPGKNCEDITLPDSNNV